MASESFEFLQNNLDGGGLSSVCRTLAEGLLPLFVDISMCEYVAAETVNTEPTTSSALGPLTSNSFTEASRFWSMVMLSGWFDFGVPTRPGKFLRRFSDIRTFLKCMTPEDLPENNLPENGFLKSVETLLTS